MRKYELLTDGELDAIHRSVRLDETTFGATQVGEEILNDIEKEFHLRVEQTTEIERLQGGLNELTH